MRKVIAGFFISLDGVVEAPQDWHFPYFNDEMGEAVADQSSNADTMLFGRITFEEFAGFWPQQGSDVPFADVINSTPKVLVTTTLKSVDWGPTTIIDHDVVESVKALKDRPGKDISITGSPTLVRTLLRVGLVDELRLLVHPIVVGHGKRLFETEDQPIPLKLITSKTFQTGVQAMTYAPADQTPAGS
jgi:dihydrofolate reductase